MDSEMDIEEESINNFEIDVDLTSRN